MTDAQPDTELVDKLVAKVIDSLKRLGGDSLLSGDDSGLVNVWEEICVQVSGEETAFWDAYLTVIDDHIRGALSPMSKEARAVLWGMTDSGIDCYAHYGAGEEQSPPIFDEDIIEMLRDKLLSRAADDDSPRVERYLSCFDEDEDAEEYEEEDEEEDEAHTYQEEDKDSDTDSLEHTDGVESGDLTGYKRFGEKFNGALIREGIPRAVGRALLTDFMRALHEIFTKSNREQTVLLTQVKYTLGVTAAQCLANVVGAPEKYDNPITRYENTQLESRLNQICAERGINAVQGRSFLESIVVALGKERFESSGQCSVLNMMYWNASDEATYHLGGLFVGDDLSIVSDELSYMDYRLSRFRTMVDQWNMEMKWDREK